MGSAMRPAQTAIVVLLAVTALGILLELLALAWRVVGR
jgi:hypothetical protein